jgi:hypothetical protein
MTGRLRAALIAAATLAGALCAPASAMSGSSSSASSHYSLGAKHFLYPSTPGGSSSAQLIFGGGVSGRGVQLHPAVYLVFWGSQWSKSDPYASYEKNFFQGLYGKGDDWTRVEAQYCDHVRSGTITCAAKTSHIGGPVGGGVLKGVWFDDSATAVPDDVEAFRAGSLTDSVAAEAVRAAQHFGNTTAAKNLNAQYIINEPTHYDSPGYGTAYCAYHSYIEASGLGSVIYTDLPYVTDIETPLHTGPTCGQNAVNSGSAGTYDGVSIVAGHEFVESMTDPYPDNGWVDGSGEETGDKCAWIASGQGAMANLHLSTGTFAVQSMWSNAANNNHGACVLHQK